GQPRLVLRAQKRKKGALKLKLFVRTGLSSGMSTLVTKLLGLHDKTFALITRLQSPFLLLVRLYWGWQLAQSGWGKLHNLANVTGFFPSLNLPLPAQMAFFFSFLVFFGGIFFALGFFPRMISLILPINFFMPYTPADREAFRSFFSDPD